MTNITKAENLIHHTSNHYLKEIGSRCPSIMMGYGSQTIMYEVNFLARNLPGKSGLVLNARDIWALLNDLGTLLSRKEEIRAKGGLPTNWYFPMLILKNDLICQQALFNIATAAKQFEDACTAGDKHKIDLTVQGEGVVYTSEQIDNFSKNILNLIQTGSTIPEELKTLVAQRPLLRQSTVLDIADFAHYVISQMQIK